MVSGVISGTFFDAPKNRKVASALQTLPIAYFSLQLVGMNYNELHKNQSKKWGSPNNQGSQKVEHRGVEPLNMARESGKKQKNVAHELHATFSPNNRPQKGHDEILHSLRISSQSEIIKQIFGQWSRISSPQSAVPPSGSAGRRWPGWRSSSPRCRHPHHLALQNTS